MIIQKQEKVLFAHKSYFYQHLHHYERFIQLRQKLPSRAYIIRCSVSNVYHFPTSKLAQNLHRYG